MYAHSLLYVLPPEVKVHLSSAVWIQVPATLPAGAADGSLVPAGVMPVEVPPLLLLPPPPLPPDPEDMV